MQPAINPKHNYPTALPQTSSKRKLKTKGNTRQPEFNHVSLWTGAVHCVVVNVKPANGPNFNDNGNTGAIPCPRAINPNSRSKNNYSNNSEKIIHAYPSTASKGPLDPRQAVEIGYPNERVNTG